MKKLGNTTSNEIMVVMTQDEFHAMSLLCLAIEGRPLESIHQMREWTGQVDITTALGAIMEYARNQDLLTAAISQLTEIKGSWEKDVQLPGLSIENMMELCAEAIKKAIGHPDGLDGGEGEHVLKLIAEFIPEAQVLQEEADE